MNQYGKLSAGLNTRRNKTKKGAQAEGLLGAGAGTGGPVAELLGTFFRFPTFASRMRHGSSPMARDSSPNWGAKASLKGRGAGENAVTGVCTSGHGAGPSRSGWASCMSSSSSRIGVGSRVAAACLRMSALV